MTDREPISSSAESTFSFKTPSNGEVVLVDDLMQDEEIRSRLTLIDSEIRKQLEENRGEPKELYETAYHLLNAGGKRLRSLLVLLACESVNGEIEKVIPIAIASEFTQTASLIHDDIIDDDSVRRGVETVHLKFGQKMAILAGDLLIAQSIRLIGKHASQEILMQVAYSGIRLCEGEAQDMLMSSDNPEVLTSEKYLDMIEKKTVSFIKTSVAIGALVVGASKEQQDALSEYGENLGFAFQIRDDILNVTSPQHITGKSMFTDLSRKRCSYPIVRAFESVTEAEKNAFLKALREGDIEFVLNLIEETNAIKDASLLVAQYVEKAKAALNGHNLSNVHLLKKVADFILHRIH